MDEQPKRRRDFLTTAALATTGIAATVALWPLIAALGPADDVRGQRVAFNLADLFGNEASLIEAGRRPIMVFRRAAEELVRLRNSQRPFDDRAKRDTKEPPGARNWHRSLRPEIGVFDATCTRGDCVVRRLTTEDDALLCPCCNSRFDLAGRVFSGLAPTNLLVPPHDYVGDTIEFRELAIYAEFRPWPASPRSRSRT